MLASSSASSRPREGWSPGIEVTSGVASRGTGPHGAKAPSSVCLHARTVQVASSAGTSAPPSPLSVIAPLLPEILAAPRPPVSRVETRAGATPPPRPEALARRETDPPDASGAENLDAAPIVAGPAAQRMGALTSFGRVSLFAGPAPCRNVEHSGMALRRRGVVPLLAVLLACAARETWAGNAVGSAIARLRGETGSGVVEETFSWDDVPSKISTDGSGRRHRASRDRSSRREPRGREPGECVFDPPAPGGHGWLSQRGMCPGVGGNCTPTGGLALSGSPPSLPSNCSKECYNIGTCNQELGRCDCPRGTEGESCEYGLKAPRRKGAG